MPIPGGAVRLELRGSGPGSEIWLTSFWFDSDSTIVDDAGVQLLVDDIQGFVSTMWNSIKPNIYPTYTLNELRAYHYPGGGDLADFSGSHLYSGLVGTQSGVGGPIDTCSVVSLRTALVGSHHRGRMYLPCHATMGSGGLLSSAIGTTNALAVATMMSAVNGAEAGSCVVVSKSLGSMQPITAVTCDNKPDVQRRRENRLTPTATAVNAVTV